MNHEDFRHLLPPEAIAIADSFVYFEYIFGIPMRYFFRAENTKSIGRVYFSAN